MKSGLGFATAVFLTNQVIDAAVCRRQKSFSIAYWVILIGSSGARPRPSLRLAPPSLCMTLHDSVSFVSALLSRVARLVRAVIGVETRLKLLSDFAKPLLVP